MSEQQRPPRYDPQTGRPLYPDDGEKGVQPAYVVLLAVVAAAIGLGAGALIFGGDDDSTDTVVTEGGRTELTVRTQTETVTAPAETVTAPPQTETVTVPAQTP